MLKKTSDLIKLNIHSNLILDKFNTRISILILLRKIILAMLAHASIREKEIADTDTKTKKVKLLLFVDYSITYLKNLSVTIENLLQAIKSLSPELI